jgi:hypothetical protein
MIENLITKIEEQWKPTGEEPFLLRIIGSSALFLQTDYVRGTKDADILEINNLSPKIWEQLNLIAGKGTYLAKTQHLYIDLVSPGLPFLPPQPLFHPLKILSEKFHYFQLQALDPIDVIISKLKTFRPSDIDDIRAMAKRHLLNPSLLVERFELAKDHWLLGSRAPELKYYIENLHTIQRDYLFVKETPIELPDWLEA